MSFVEKPEFATGVRNVVTEMLADAKDVGSLVTVFVRNAANPDDPFLRNRIKGIGGCKVGNIEDGSCRVETQKWRVDMIKRVWPALEISPKPFR